MTVLSESNFLQAITEDILIKSRKKIPLVIAVDGGSGGGKSTIAQMIAKRVNGIIIPLDDFYAGNIPDKKWDEFSIEKKLQEVFQWERLLTTAIKPLLAGNSASWTTYDFSSIQDDGTYKQQPGFQTISPSDIIIIDGAYSASPAIVEFIDITILVDVPIEERHKRLNNRESFKFLKGWHERWDAVESYYFTKLRPDKFFDFVIKNY